MQTLHIQTRCVDFIQFSLYNPVVNLQVLTLLSLPRNSSRRQCAHHFQKRWALAVKHNTSFVLCISNTGIHAILKCTQTSLICSNKQVHSAQNTTPVVGPSNTQPEPIFTLTELCQSQSNSKLMLTLKQMPECCLLYTAKIRLTGHLLYAN